MIDGIVIERNDAKDNFDRMKKEFDKAKRRHLDEEEKKESESLVESERRFNDRFQTLADQFSSGGSVEGRSKGPAEFLSSFLLG